MLDATETLEIGPRISVELSPFNKIPLISELVA